MKGDERLCMSSLSPDLSNGAVPSPESGRVPPDNAQSRPTWVIFNSRKIAAAVSPLHKCFSFTAPRAVKAFDPPCIRCPNCKGCQLHLQLCSGAYGMRHTLAWLVRRRPPAEKSRRSIKLHGAVPIVDGAAAPEARRACRFETGPVAITQHLTYMDRHQLRETMNQTARKGPFGGMACPRPLPVGDIYFRVFYWYVRNGLSRLPFRFFQRTAMRTLASEARALWEKLTFVPERGFREKAPVWRPQGGEVPRRVPIAWNCPPMYISLLPQAKEGNRGMTFKLWLFEEDARSLITGHVVEAGYVWDLPHTCGFRCKTDTTMDEAEDAIARVAALLPRWEGELQCPLCCSPQIQWGYIVHRHRSKMDRVKTILRVRHSSVRRRVERRAALGRHGSNGSLRNEVVWMNRHKTRAQVMTFIMAFHMRNTLCGPLRQRHLPMPPG
uniref:Uncharacterized protein n=1 Tax=Trypanosoma congolense (strain IL3000) TaxID=1068625 RepID=G0ULF5_TRYCI|nr:conserved hypothetical protein [Trypanosoma congolense IL3000]